MVCPPNAGSNPVSPAQLVSHFVQIEKGKTPAAVVSKSVRHMFGWPLAISYAIRNHFVHDGAQFGGQSGERTVELAVFDAEEHRLLRGQQLIPRRALGTEESGQTVSCPRYGRRSATQTPIAASSAALHLRAWPRRRPASTRPSTPCRP